MCAGYAQALVCTGQGAQYLSTLLDGEAVFMEENQLLVLCWDSWCVNHQGALGILAGLRDEVYVLLVVDEHALFLQLMGELGRSLVVSCYYQLLAEEVSGDGAHADTAGTYKINSFDIFDFHYFVANLMTSSAMTSAEFFKPNFLMFSQSEASLASSFTVSTAFFSNTSGASASFT